MSVTSTIGSFSAILKSSDTSMRIGILQADSVLPQFQPEFGDYPRMIGDVLTAVDPSLLLRTYDVEHGEYPADLAECDAYVITGSRQSVYDPEPWIKTLRQFVVLLHERRIPLIGICFGHQMVAEALGGKTLPAAVGWCVGVHQSRVIRSEGFMDPPLPVFNLISSHKDQVARLPEGAVLLAASEQCPCAMYRVGDHILTVQGHPEFCKPYSRALMTYRETLLGQEKFDAGLASLALPTNEHIIAQWILNFLRQRCLAPDQSLA
ncbi:MAG: GMP synthase [Pseudomonadota bacterium]